MDDSCVRDIQTRKYRFLLGIVQGRHARLHVHVTREEVSGVQVIKCIGRMPHLSHDQMRGMMDMAIEGNTVLGYTTRR